MARRTLVVAALAGVVVLGIYAIHARGVPVPAIDGRVVDAETGDGVSGAHLFRTVTLADRLAVLVGQLYYPLTVDWTSTDAEGRFHFGETRSPGVGGLRWRRKEGQSLDWVHREYGWGEVFGIEVEVSIDAPRNEHQVRHLQEPDRLHRDESIPWPRRPCSLHYNSEATAHCCQVVYQGHPDIRNDSCDRWRVNESS